MEKCQRSPEDVKKSGALTVQRMEPRAQVRGLLAFVSTSNDGKKRMQFVNQDFHAAINTRRGVFMNMRPAAQTESNFVGPPPKAAFYKEKLKPTADGGSMKNATSRLFVGAPVHRT